AVVLYYHNPSSDADLIIRQIISPINNTTNNIISSSSSLPLLNLHFQLRTYEKYCYRPVPHDHQYPAQFQGQRTLILLRDLELPPFLYMSYDMFYRAMQGNLKNWGEEFDRNYRDKIIHDMIVIVRKLVDDVSNKHRQNLKVFVGVSLTVNHFLDRKISLEETSSSIERIMEIDEDERTNDDCVVCLEQLGKERKILCMPCSHMFHKVCITKWFEKKLHCPICHCEI
ncbi:hypothetical protein A4A49_56889, partial [Nicotiana attenuata]